MKIWRRDELNHEAFPLLAMPCSANIQSENDFPRLIELYGVEDLAKFKAEAKLARDAADISLSETLIEALKVRGQMRELMIMRSTFRKDLENLLVKFPNFSEVIGYLRRCAEIAWRTDKVLRFTPILLNGPGGVGKTFFSEALAKWMNHGFHRISISSSQNGSELAGSSSFFSNSKPGVPFNSLIYSDYANSLIFLDEIDKNSTQSYDALGALYVLLEPETSRNYKDQSINLPLDASHLLWIAASNDADQLHPALRSRFIEFEISITPEQSRVIANSIVAAVLESLSPATDRMVFSAAAIETLSQLTPRKIRQAALDAIGNAFVHDQTQIEVITLGPKAKIRVGFLS